MLDRPLTQTERSKGTYRTEQVDTVTKSSEQSLKGTGRLMGKIQEEVEEGVNTYFSIKIMSEIRNYEYHQNGETQD